MKSRVFNSRLGLALLGLASVSTLTFTAELRVAAAPLDARMMRYPDVSASQIAFVYAGDIWIAPKAGGPAARLTSSRGEEMFPKFSLDGKILAYTPISVDFRTWKRYRGGINPDIWFFDLEKKTGRNVTQNPANDSLPMWHGITLYFLSDRDEFKRDNLWAYDPRTSQFRQVTFFKDYDVHFPSMAWCATSPATAAWPSAGPPGRPTARPLPISATAPANMN